MGEKMARALIFPEPEMITEIQTCLVEGSCIMLEGFIDRRFEDGYENGFRFKIYVSPIIACQYL